MVDAKMEVIELSSDDEAAPMPAVKMTTRGPKKARNDTYDKHCVYANQVALNPSQVKYLKCQVRDKKPRIPYYVCTIQEAHIIPHKAKMYFNKEYTTRHIKKDLASEEHHSLKVYSKKKKIFEVRMIFGKGKGKGACITSKWKDVVDKTKMMRGDIFLFWFHRSLEDGLKIVVDKVVQGDMYVDSRPRMDKYVVAFGLGYLCVMALVMICKVMVLLI